MEIGAEGVEHWKIRNPKSEIRKKSEDRNPKAEGVGASQAQKTLNIESEF